MADLLSQNIFAEDVTLTFKSRRSCENHNNSQVPKAIARYSDSVLLRLTTVYFLDFQLIKEVPRYTHNPVTDRRVS